MHALLRGPLSLGLGSPNPRFEVCPVELGLGTLMHASMSGPLSLC